MSTTDRRTEVAIRFQGVGSGHRTGHLWLSAALCDALRNPKTVALQLTWRILRDSRNWKTRRVEQGGSAWVNLGREQQRQYWSGVAHRIDRCPYFYFSLASASSPPSSPRTSINLVRRLVHCPRQTSVASILGTAGPVPLSPLRRYGNTTATYLRHRYSPPLLSLPGAGAQRQHPHCSRRTQGRRGDLAARAGEVITRLPETGWPAGLFARRDAMILTLAATGLTYTQIAARRICDVTADPVADALHVDAVDRIATIPPGLVAAGSCPTRVHRR